MAALKTHLLRAVYDWAVESGFTPAALSLLATAVGARAGRGAAMGIYSFLLSLGALVGNLLAVLEQGLQILEQRHFTTSKAEFDWVGPIGFP